MSVADRFGSKYEIIADLTIQPTAAYLLAAPSVPDEAREKAVARAKSGERITAAIAKEIVAASRKKRVARNHAGLSTEKLRAKLGRTLERFRARWKPNEFATMAKQLRRFANLLYESPTRQKKNLKG